MTESCIDDQKSQKLVVNSKLFREIQAEQEEVEKHKWLESEKVGRDIGWEQAKTDWNVKHRPKWKRARNKRAA